jgi:Transposase IS116/IS110/IS902 family
MNSHETKLWGIPGGLLAGLLLVLMAVLAGGAALRESVTIDEVAHIGAGVSYLQKLDLRMNPEHPPLPKVLAALPLVCRGVRADYSHISWTTSEKFLPAFLGQWVFGDWLLERWRDLFAESKEHKAWKRLCQIPSIGPIRAAVLMGILQTPHRFRTKRQLWTYCGFGIEVHSSADHHVVKGQLERKKKHIEIRGLNENCNHDLKNLFKGAAVVASTKPGPFEQFYAALVAKGMRPEMARLTLARKIATIVLIVWTVCFDAQHLKPQTALSRNSALVLYVRPPPGPRRRGIRAWRHCT